MDQQPLGKQEIMETAAGSIADARGLPPAPKAKLIVLYAAIMLCGLFSGKFIIDFFEKKASISPASLSPSSLKVSGSPNPLPAHNQFPQEVSAEAKESAVAQPELVSAQPAAEPLTSHTVISEIPASNSEPIFVLNGIYLDSGGGCALINNKVVKEGEMVGGAKVKRINTDNVQLDLSGKMIEISL